MSTLATVALTLAGIALIAFAVRDIFETLLHPEGRGPLARGVLGAVWRACRRLRRRRLLLRAGPLGLLLVVGFWAVLLVLGWALLLWPQLGDGFRPQEAGSTGFWDALHLSLTTLTTLGSPDLVPDEDWLRIITPLEALVGFGLLSASISYLLLIYPALARRRSLAYEVFLLQEAERQADPLPEQLGPAAAEGLYADLTSRVVAVERDLVNLPVTYYFAESDERFSLAAVAPYLLDLARRGSRLKGREQVRLRAQLLVDALEDLAQTTAGSFPSTRADSTDAIFAAYARDHVTGGSA
jgi:hypothetical protein